MFHHLSRFTVLIISMSVTLSGFAQAQEAQAYLQTKHDEVERLIQRPENARRDSELTALLDSLLDYRELSRRALGDHWAAQSEEAQTEFVSILKQLVERSYRNNLRRTLRFDVRYHGSETQGEDTLIRTEARDRDNRRAPPIVIEYRMHRTDQQWRVVDLTIDGGMSMVQNYRRQFNRLIGREGWDGLMSRMRARLTE